MFLFLFVLMYVKARASEENSYRSLQSNDALKVLRSESSFDSIGESGWTDGSQRHNSVHAAKNEHRAPKIKHIPSAESYFSQPFQLLLMIGKKDSLLSNMFSAVTSEKLILGATDSHSKTVDIYVTEQQNVYLVYLFCLPKRNQRMHGYYFQIISLHSTRKPFPCRKIPAAPSTTWCNSYKLEAIPHVFLILHYQKTTT
ncbi:hypothetical protein YC2023_072582 [Brassica napus]